MKNKIILSIIIFIVIFIITIIMLINGGNTSKNKIIKNFKNNEELFENVIMELTEESEDVYIEKKGNVILISIYQHIDDKVNIVRVKEEEFYKFKQTIELIKLLDIKKISKTNEIIDFLFTDSFLDGGKTIVFMEGEEDNIYNIYKIIEKKQISENWYYVLLDAL